MINEKDLFFIGFISNYGDCIKIDNMHFNHTKLAEKLVTDDPWLKKKMAKSKYFIAIDFLIHEMGYLKIGNRKKKEIVYSITKKKSKVIEDYILLYKTLGYSENKI